MYPDCPQPSLGKLGNLGSSCPRRIGCQHLKSLKMKLILPEADFLWMPAATGAVGRHGCSCIEAGLVNDKSLGFLKTGFKVPAGGDLQLRQGS